MRRLFALLLLTSACGGTAEPVVTCPATCAGETICVSGTCKDAFPAKYSIVVNASLAPKAPGGDCWDDPFCGDPDLLVTVSFDGRVVGMTSEQGGTFTHDFVDEPIVATLTKGGQLQLIAYDVDLDTNDVAATCTASVTLDLIKGGVIRCSAASGQSTVGATIEREIPVAM